MPQSNLRSGVYRSFIMCDDPREVVESGAIRKQKSRSNSSSSSSRHEHTLEGKEQRGSCEDKTKMPKKMDMEIGFTASSSLQLLRVSRGIQKLNEAIESWSKGLSYEVKPDRVAKDLLRGALDLEESLAMLGKFQEISYENMKQKPRNSSFKKEGRNNVLFQRSMSDRFVAEKRMIEDEVSSRDCYEELRKVIQESFSRQNLLPRTSMEAKSEDFQSKFSASSSGAASMSSDQSSTIRENDSGSQKSLVSSDVPPRSKARGSNLIAKLMGLDGFPMEQTKSKIHVDKAVIKNPSLEGRDAMKRTESFETKQAKEVKEIALQTSAISSSPATIVLIKPLRFQQPETDAKAKRKTPVVPKKPRMQGEIHPRMITKGKDRATGSVMTRNKMKLPLSPIMKDKEEKKIKQTTSNTVSKASKQVINCKTIVKKKDAEGKDGKDRRRSPDSVRRIPQTSTVRRSKLDSNSTAEHKTIQAKNVGEVKRSNAKKKSRKQDLTSEINSVSSRDSVLSVNQLSAEKETSSTEIHIQGHGDIGEISSRDISIHHSYDDENQETCSVGKLNDAEISLKSFLFSSSTFLSYVKDLFELNSNIEGSLKPYINISNNIVLSDQRLALDYAKEVATRKSLSTSVGTLCISLEELLREICDGFEILRSYSNMFSRQNYINDSVHMMLEKDLKGAKTEMVSGIWDFGWRSEFQIQDTHQVVIEVEKLILCCLIEEILS